MGLTSHERVMAAFEHREPDRTPIFEYVLGSSVADAILGRSYAEGAHFHRLVAERGWETAVRQQAIDRVELADQLEHDMLYITPNPLPPAHPTSPVDTHMEPPRDDPVETVARRLAQAEAEGVVSPPDERFLIYRFVQEEMDRRGIDLPIMAPAYAHGIWTDVALMQTMLLEPDVAHRHFALATKRALQLVEKYLSRHITLIGVGGDFAGNLGPLISPHLYRAFIVPEVRTVSRYVHQAGGKTINGSDGNLWPVIEEFLVGCETDGYIEIQFRAGMDLGRLKRLFGEHTVFLGNLDCSHILSFGTPEDVRAHTTTCLRHGWGNGGHILCCDNAIIESIPVGNFLAIREGYREFFGL